MKDDLNSRLDSFRRILELMIDGCDNNIENTEFDKDIAMQFNSSLKIAYQDVLSITYGPIDIRALNRRIIEKRETSRIDNQDYSRDKEGKRFIFLGYWNVSVRLYQHFSDIIPEKERPY